MSKKRTGLENFFTDISGVDFIAKLDEEKKQKELQEQKKIEEAAQKQRQIVAQKEKRKLSETKKLSVLENERKLKFDHSNEIVEPHYYSVILDEIKTKVEFTVTDRSSFFKFNFPKSENSNIIIDAFFKNSEIKVIPDQNKIVGIAKNNSGKTKVILSYRNRDLIVPVSSKEEIYFNINE